MMEKFLILPIFPSIFLINSSNIPRMPHKFHIPCTAHIPIIPHITHIFHISIISIFTLFLIFSIFLIFPFSSYFHISHIPYISHIPLWTNDVHNFNFFHHTFGFFQGVEKMEACIYFLHFFFIFFRDGKNASVFSIFSRGLKKWKIEKTWLFFPCFSFLSGEEKTKKIKG